MDEIRLLFFIFIQILTHMAVYTWNIPANAACEHSYLTLNCLQGYHIKITYANYGRRISSAVFCPSHITHNDRIDCVASNSQSIVQTVCDGKQTCPILASNRVFRDPCVNTYKYLDLEFDCITDGIDRAFTISTPPTPLMSSVMLTETLPAPTSSTSESGDNTVTWVLIWIAEFFAGIILTIITVCCLKRKRMSQGSLQNKVPPSDPPAYTAEPCATQNDVCSVEHTYEKLQKENILYEDIAEDLDEGRVFYENCSGFHLELNDYENDHSNKPVFPL